MKILNFFSKLLARLFKSEKADYSEVIGESPIVNWQIRRCNLPGVNICLVVSNYDEESHVVFICPIFKMSQFGRIINSTATIVGRYSVRIPGHRGNYHQLDLGEDMLIATNLLRAVTKGRIIGPPISVLRDDLRIVVENLISEMLFNTKKENLNVERNEVDISKMKSIISEASNHLRENNLESAISTISLIENDLDFEDKENLFRLRYYNSLVGTKEIDKNVDELKIMTARFLKKLALFLKSIDS